jgi:hypothetical protein
MTNTVARRIMVGLLPGRVIAPADAAVPARRIGLTLAAFAAGGRTICLRSIRFPSVSCRGG